MWRRLIRALVLALVARPLAAQGAPPPAAFIRGVPFVSWREANAQRYENASVVNPSIQAANEMLAWYWSDAVHSAADAERATRDAAWKRQAYEDAATSMHVATLDSLKRLVARGVPVMVGPALTPYAHPLYPMWDMLRAMNIVKVGLPEGPRSGILGKMLPLDSVAPLARAIREGAKTDINPVHETVIYAARIVIGYDDARQVVTMHDPSFGPAFEISYADFERMWEPGGRSGTAVLPPGWSVIAERRMTVTTPYRQRTADERAAWEYVNGYALSATGRPAEGIERFRAGLAVPGVSASYRHLLLLDLAISLGGTGMMDDAVVAARAAAQLVPDHVRAWGVLADAYPRCGLPERESLGAQAADRAKRLAMDRKAQERAYAALPHDFMIWAP